MSNIIGQWRLRAQLVEHHLLQNLRCTYHRHIAASHRRTCQRDPVCSGRFCARINSNHAIQILCWQETPGRVLIVPILPFILGLVGVEDHEIEQLHKTPQAATHASEPWCTARMNQHTAFLFHYIPNVRRIGFGTNNWRTICVDLDFGILF